MHFPVLLIIIFQVWKCYFIDLCKYDRDCAVLRADSALIAYIDLKISVK